MSIIDPVKVALELTSKLDDILKRCRETKEAVARRANDLANLLTQLGFTPTLTFYLSKASERKRVYSDLIGYLTGKSEIKSLNITNICRDVTGEGSGYSILLALVTACLFKLGYIEENKIPSTFRDLIDFLKNIREKGKELSVERSLSPVVIELKKLLNALYG